nr:DNA translocase FtsK [Methylobacterium terrae]
MPIPPAGPARAVLTRARRREAEPDQAAPEVRARPAPVERPAEAGVRFTRTPDHVLQARQRRREQAVREKEEARLAAEAEAAARAAAEIAAAEAARAEADAARAEAEARAAAAAVPLWRQPYVLPPGVRFTRTPDHLLRHPQETAPQGEAAPREGGVSRETAASDETIVSWEAVASWETVTFLETAATAEATSPAEGPAVAGAPTEPVTMMEPVAEPTAQGPAAPETRAGAQEITVPQPAAPASEIAAVLAGTFPSTPDLSIPEPATAMEAPVQVFDVPNSAILVPVDVSHLRSLPPRPVYALDRLLQHDWTRPLPTAAEQDNRLPPEAVVEAPQVEALQVEVLQVEALQVEVLTIEALPDERQPAENLHPAEEPRATVEVVVAEAGAVPGSVGDAPVEIVIEADVPVIVPADAEGEPAPAAERNAAATPDAIEPASSSDLSAVAGALPATILLPAPAPMLALTYAPLADEADVPDSPEATIISVPVAVEPPAAPLPLAAPLPVDEMSAATPQPAFMPMAFAPVPWSFIAAGTLPVAMAEETAQADAPQAATALAPAPVEDPAAEPAGRPASQPFVYVPTGRLNAQPPAPTLPAPPRPPRIILPIASPSVPIASQPVPIASQPVPMAEQPVPAAMEAASPAPEPDSVTPAWSAALPEVPAAEPHGLVIGTTGLVTDLGLDADDDGEDEDDILAPVATIPLRPAARMVEVPYELPSVDLLAEPRESDGSNLDPEMLEDNALQLQQVIQDFGVRGEILAVRPGPVVTLYEMEPAPGTKSSRVISLADDIARSMSAISARVAVVQGRNAIGIELPNLKRETVYLRELLTSPVFTETKQKLALCLGKNIGGEAIIADLARMPHLLVAGTTGSGKSVAINTMILSLLYRMKPEECRLIMVDPKMLELSVYDGIPHLLSPVVTDPKKAVIALKWAVREMEERYKKMARLGVRNIDGFNARVAEARARGEVITRTVQTGFDRETGEAVYEDEVMDLSALPYIVIVVDEMADLMMVAGKDIEGAIQRLAQMARAAGLHLIMATQRPSVDVITGTIKANFPTRISFQVTSKIDSRTILGEMGAEQLLGQGDMLFMAGGGRTTRVHGPFCSDDEVEQVVAHLKRQGRPSYLDAVTADDEVEEAAASPDTPVMDQGSFGDPAADLYDQAVAVVLRDKKASTSYIQRRLQIGYNRAASLMERMEREGIVGPANHAGKREILIEPAPQAGGEEA